MGCAQSRNGGYYYPSFLEGPVDRINSSDPQSAVDFVDRVLDQIDLALDGERPTPTRTFTAAEAEVVETAWRGAGLLPDSRISLRQFQALLPMILSEAPFQGLDLDVLQDHISAERLSQRRKEDDTGTGASSSGTGAALRPDAAPVAPASTTLALPAPGRQQQQQANGDSDWQTVLNDPGGAGGGACAGGWPASACSAAGGAEQGGGDDASGPGAHHDHAQLSLKATMRVLARLLAPAEESTQAAADVGCAPPARLPVALTPRPLPSPSPHASSPRPRTDSHAVSALLVLEDEGVVITASESLSYLDQLERGLETIGLLPAETSLGGIAAFDLRAARGAHAPRASGGGGFGGGFGGGSDGSGDGSGGSGCVGGAASAALRAAGPHAAAAAERGGGIGARWVLPLQAGATSLGWDAAKRHLFVGTSSGAVKIFVVSADWSAVNYKFAVEAHTARVTAVMVLPAPKRAAAVPSAAATLSALEEEEEEEEEENPPRAAVAAGDGGGSSGGGGGGGGDPLGVQAAAAAETAGPLLFRTRGQAAARLAAERNAFAYGSAPLPPVPAAGSDGGGGSSGGGGVAAVARRQAAEAEAAAGGGGGTTAGGSGGGAVAGGAVRRVQVLASCSAENGPHALCLYDTDSMAALHAGQLLLPKHLSLFAKVRTAQQRLVE